MVADRCHGQGRARGVACPWDCAIGSRQPSATPSFRAPRARHGAGIPYRPPSRTLNSLSQARPDAAALRDSGRSTADDVATETAIGQTDTVLEIGCGIGRVGEVLATRCREWIGADVSAGMCAPRADCVGGTPERVVRSSERRRSVGRGRRERRRRVLHRRLHAPRRMGAVSLRRGSLQGRSPRKVASMWTTSTCGRRKAGGSSRRSCEWTRSLDRRT